MRKVSLRFKIIVFPILILAIIFLIQALIMIQKNIAEKEEKILEESITFSVLSKGPIIKNYKVYYFSGFYKFKEVMNDLKALNSDLDKFQIINLKGEILFDSASMRQSAYVDPAQEEYKLIDESKLESIISSESSVNKIVVDKKQMLEIIQPYFEEWGRHDYTVRYLFSFKSLEDSTRRIIYGIGISLLIFFVMSGSLFFSLFNYLIIKPLRKLGGGVNALRQGKLDYKVDIESNDEIGELGSAFNQMSSDLQKTTVSITILEESQKRFEDVTSTTGDWIWEVNQDGQYTYSNPTVEKILGYSADDILGKHFFDFFLPEESEQLKKGIFSVFKEQKVLKDFVVRNTRKDGAQVILERTGVPMTNIDGEFIGYRGADRDITERKKAEEDLKKAYDDLKSTQEQLIKAEKLAGIGQLAAGVAHEINNPTGFVMSNLQVLRKNFEKILGIISNTDEFINSNALLSKDASLQENYDSIVKKDDIDYFKEDIPLMIDESLEGTTRIKNIVLGLREFAHPGQEDYILTNINEIIEKSLTLTRGEFKYKNEVVQELSNVPDIKVNPTQIEQVLVNMLINASQAISEKGEVRIKTFLQDKYAVIEISDNGKGIPQEVVEKIFDPFFTSKAVGVGTGLGLSIVYRIITDHGGTIDVKSQIDEGTTFTIKLPVGQYKKI